MPSAAVTVRWRQRAIVWSGSRHATHHSVESKIKCPVSGVWRTWRGFRARNARGNVYDLIVTHHWLSPLTLALELALTIDTCIRTHHSHSPSTLALSLTIGYYNWRSHSNWPSPLTLAWTLTIDTRIDTHHWHSPSTIALFMFGSMTQQ